MMKNKQVVELFLRGQKGHAANLVSTGTQLLLFGNIIAKWDNGLWITDAGWDTHTTNKILNMIPKAREFRENNPKWDGRWTKLEV